MTKISIEYLLLFVVIICLVYYSMGSCGCGFSVGGDTGSGGDGTCRCCQNTHPPNDACYNNQGDIVTDSSFCYNYNSDSDSCPSYTKEGGRCAYFP